MDSVPLQIRVWLPDNHGLENASQAEGDAQSGFIADFMTFAEMPEVVYESATECRLVSPTPSNGYLLGEYSLPLPGGDGISALITSNGMSVVVEGPTVDAVRQGWNTHMCAVSRWLYDGSEARAIADNSQEAGEDVIVPGFFEIRVYGKGGQFPERDGTQCFAPFRSFVEAHDAKLADACHYQLLAGTVPNDFELGTDVGGADDEAFEIMSTGKLVIITSNSLNVIQETWGRYCEELQRHIAETRGCCGVSQYVSRRTH